MSFSLDDLCVRHRWTKSRNKRQISSQPDLGGPAGVLVVSSVDLVTYSLEFEIFDEDDVDDLDLFFESVGFTRSFDFTPPDATTPQRFRFQNFVLNHDRPYIAEATVQLFRGV